MGIEELFSLRGKTAVVTGGSRGIGLMIAAGLIGAGARVVISARNAQACDEAVTHLRTLGDARAVPADLAVQDECKRFASDVEANEGEVHLLVNNAASAWGAPLLEYPAAAWDKVLNINLKSPFFLVQSFLPLLKRVATSDDPARIINIGSTDAIFVTDRHHYAYATSKAAIHHLTRILAVELAAQHITVNTIAPGPVHTKMMGFLLDDDDSRHEVEQSIPLGRLAVADDLAGTAVFLASKAGAYITGTVIPLDGGALVAH